jgi:hypothetical protein
VLVEPLLAPPAAAPGPRRWTPFVSIQKSGERAFARAEQTPAPMAQAPHGLEQFADECARKATGSSRRPRALPPGQRSSIFRDANWSRPRRSRCQISFPAETADRFPVDPRTDPTRRGFPAWHTPPPPGPLATGLPHTAYGSPYLVLRGGGARRKIRKIFAAAGSRHRTRDNENLLRATPRAPLGRAHVRRAHGRLAAQEMASGQLRKAVLSARATAQTRRARAFPADW